MRCRERQREGRVGDQRREMMRGGNEVWGLCKAGVERRVQDQRRRIRKRRRGKVRRGEKG